MHFTELGRVYSMLTRRFILGSGLAAVAAPSIVRAAPITNRATSRLVVLGDSYSDTGFNPVPSVPDFPMWDEQLVNRGRAGSLRSFAKAGATAKNYSGAPALGTFKLQLDQFLANPQYGPDDVTVVYLGYNDIARSTETAFTFLNDSKADYRVGVDRLLTAGAASGNRRLLLTAVHDWSKNPKKRAEFVPRTRNWLAFTYDFIAKRRATWKGIITANIYRRFSDIYARPYAYGLNNVTTVDAARSGSTALYLNDNHFGLKGHTLLADEFSRTLDLVLRTR